MTQSQDVAKKEDVTAGGAPPLCTCIQDPFAGLPPELRPKPQPKKSGLRQATCPACGMNYWTNRPTDLCIECEKKGLGGQGSAPGA